ncbi:MAG: NAD+ synthase [Candidatus Diapherotrites archaeon]|nr:NAD+ synthase [Candidatus Diapherotrites archaeon]
MDSKKTFAKIVKGTKDYFKKAGCKKAVFGLSGGIDSAVTAYVLEKALGPENVFALFMPYEVNDSRQDLRDALKVAAQTQIGFCVFPIKKICDEFDETVWMPNRLAKANLRARARMMVLYSFANSQNALVVGTSNRTELLLGYFTKQGDGACDIMPLASLYKGEIMKLAGWLGVPKEIIRKKPTAGLWRGQTDEGEIGVKYEVIDEILRGYFDRKENIKALEKKFGKTAVSKVLSRAEKNAHKGKLPFAVEA